MLTVENLVISSHLLNTNYMYKNKIQYKILHTIKEIAFIYYKISLNYSPKVDVNTP